MTIKEHLVDVPTNVGALTFISTNRKSVPKGLKNPYEYILPIQDADNFYKELKAYMSQYPEADNSVGVQCNMVSKKGLAKGLKLEFFVLAYKVGLCGDQSGLPRKTWQKLCKDVQDIYFKYLGKDARIYAEKYSATEKFQARMTTYIAYKELV